MESVPKKSNFWPKMMVKSGREKILLKFLHAVDYFSLLYKSVQNEKFSNRNKHLPAWRHFKTIFSRPLFTIIFRPKIVSLGTDSILMVKRMYDSVKTIFFLNSHVIERSFSPWLYVLLFKYLLYLYMYANR